MRLTTFSDYTMRTLVYLGLKEGRLATIVEVAVAYGISKNHLMKVAHYLGQQGYLETIRGKGGGIRLVRPPSDINIGELLSAIEGNSLLDCQNMPAQCCIQPACKLISILQEAQDAMFEVLCQYTLADLLQPQALLLPLLAPQRLQPTGPVT